MSLNTAEVCARLWRKQSFGQCLEGKAGDLDAMLPPLVFQSWQNVPPHPPAQPPQSPPTQIPSPRLWNHWVGWRWPPGSESPGNINWKHRSIPGRGETGVLVIRLSSQTWKVHVAQTGSHNHPGPGSLSCAALPLATGPWSVPFWMEESVLILALG